MMFKRQGNYSAMSPSMCGPNAVREGDVSVVALSCKVRTLDLCSSEDTLDICLREVLAGMSLSPLCIVGDSSDTSYICFPPGGAAVGQAEITAVW